MRRRTSLVYVLVPNQFEVASFPMRPKLSFLKADWPLFCLAGFFGIFFR
jgi:hypothetical protein